MCVGRRFKTCSAAMDYFEQARKCLLRDQHQKAFEEFEQAEKEIQIQKEGLRKYL